MQEYIINILLFINKYSVLNKIIDYQLNSSGTANNAKYCSNGLSDWKLQAMNWIKNKVIYLHSALDEMFNCWQIRFSFKLFACFSFQTYVPCSECCIRSLIFIRMVSSAYHKCIMVQFQLCQFICLLLKLLTHLTINRWL